MKSRVSGEKQCFSLKNSVFHVEKRCFSFFTHSACHRIPTCWYLKTLKFALPPMETPNMNRWNIGHVGHVGLMFVSFSLALGSQHEHNSQ